MEKNDFEKISLKNGSNKDLGFYGKKVGYGNNYEAYGENGKYQDYYLYITNDNNYILYIKSYRGAMCEYHYFKTKKRI